MAKHVVIEKWLSLYQDEGKGLLSIQEKERLGSKNPNEPGALYEEVAVEFLLKLGFSDVVIRHSFYDIEAMRGSDRSN